MGRSGKYLVLGALVFKAGQHRQALNSSLTGYFLAFCVGLAAYGLGMWLLERWMFDRM